MSKQQFFVNTRASKKGSPKKSWTVHRERDCIRTPKNPNNWLGCSAEELFALARKQSLGACKKCWGDEAEKKTGELQDLWENK